ncbi:MAG: phosphatidate cytidylyltransferase, partial [Candidatus Neomarinimicrobiota bacterium]
IWISDSAAYAFGKKWGKKKILERVSPKKTITGSVAGLVSAVGFYLLVWRMGLLESSQSAVSLSGIDALALGLIVGLFGQLGDFAESAVKRDMGVKDSGSILPGHGGVLDRFDSLSVASPMTFLYLTLSYF